ncbi:type II secretion system F family protein [Govanella unica]|uniref:Type II secretion system F family protein n=1 Tax=Govanella unica TaxID=2975056 RepID=A0A9X3U083_9PROT|nr:type II secretion system F family protein [Govania unica]MDA5194965.1 type II secretion system F family protein [Govania unica]
MDNLPFGLKPQDLITLMAAASAFLMVLAVWSSGLVSDPMRGRLEALKNRRDALKSGYIAARKRTPVKRTKSVGFMREVLNRVNVVKEEQSRKFSQQLAAAGIRSRDGVVILMFFKLILPILIGLIALVMIFGLKLFDWSQPTKFAAFVGSMLLASMAPDFYLKNLVQKRQQAIRKGLPDALDLLVICAEAGLTLDAALQRVARENQRACPELADELGLTSIELGFLPDRRQALANLAARVELPAVKAVVATLSQAEKYGTPLAQSLRVLSAEFRNERMMKAEEKAARLPAIMTIPLIVFIMPTLFVVLMGPAACSISDNLMK